MASCTRRRRCSTTDLARPPVIDAARVHRSKLATKRERSAARSASSHRATRSVRSAMRARRETRRAGQWHDSRRAHGRTPRVSARTSAVRRSHGLATSRASRRRRSPRPSGRGIAFAGCSANALKFAELAPPALAHRARRAPRRRRNRRRTGTASRPPIPRPCTASESAARAAGRPGRARDAPGREVGQALAEGAIADLVVVLQEGDEGRGRQMGGGLAARLRPRVCAKARPGRRSLRRAQRPSRSTGCVGVILIVAVGLAGQRERASNGGGRRSIAPCAWRGAPFGVARRASAPHWPRSPARDGSAGPGSVARTRLGDLGDDVRARCRPGWRGRRRSAGRRSGIPRASRARCG